MYENLSFYIDGKFVPASNGRGQDVVNPASGKVLANVPHASKADLDAALVAADKAYQKWRKVSAFERGKLLRKAADLVRARAEDIAKVLTQEQGKPLAESRLEVSKWCQASGYGSGVIQEVPSTTTAHVHCFQPAVTQSWKFVP